MGTAADHLKFGMLDKPVLERQGKSNSGAGVKYQRETGRMNFGMGPSTPKGAQNKNPKFIPTSGGAPLQSQSLGRVRPKITINVGF